MTYDRLLQRVRGVRSSGDSRRVRTAAKQLRRKLGDDANNPAHVLNELQRRPSRGWLPLVGSDSPVGERLMSETSKGPDHQA